MIINLYYINIEPYIGIEVSKNSNNEYIITNIDEKDGWARFTTLKIGDLVKSIDGEPLEAVKLIRGNCIEVTYDYETEVVENTKKEIGEMLFTPKVFTILTIILYVLTFKNKSLTNKYFNFFTMNVALSILASTESGRGDILSKIIISITLPLSTLFLMLFIYELLLKRRLIHRKVKKWIYYNSILGLIVIIFSISSIFLNQSSLSGNMLLFYFCFNIIIINMYLGYKYSSNRNHVGILVIKWILIIHFLAFAPFILLHSVPLLLGLPYLNDAWVTLFLFIIPIGYFYLVVSKQLIDINFYIHRLFHYTLLSFIPLILIVFPFLFELVTIENSLEFYLISSFLIIISIVILLIIKEKLDFFLPQYMDYNKSNLTYDLEAFIQKLPSCMSILELEGLLLKQLDSTLEPTIVLKAYCDKSLDIQKIDLLKGDMGNGKYTDQINYAIKKNKKNELLVFKNFLGMKFYQANELEVYIWVGYKANYASFNSPEKIWFKSVVKYFKIVYESINTINDIHNDIENGQYKTINNSLAFSRFLFQLSEKERQRLAVDLHDTVLQEQIFLYRKIEQLTLCLNSSQSEQRQQLEYIKVATLEIINQMRSTCNELRPNLITELGLISALKDLCKSNQKKSDYKIEHDFSITGNKEPNLEISIYRIIQELLNNALKHSNASKISICLWEDSFNIYLDYEDNGSGIDFIHKPTLNSHMGIEGIKERIRSFDGDIDFVSRPDKGLEVYITIPQNRNYN